MLRVVVWCSVSRMMSHFFNASISPHSCYSINPFLQIILVQNSYSAASLLSSSDDMSLLFFIYPYSMMVAVSYEEAW